MRRNLAVLVALLMFLVAVAAPAFAQAPAPSPRVTISGFVDNVSSYSRNMSVVDINPGRQGDKEWYARTRVRPDITAELGTTKFVLGLEIDFAWGQTANGQDTVVCLNAACANAPQRSGANAGLDLNTDTTGIIEIKWAYTEFRLPLIPVPTVVRLGAQPFQATYKLAAYATGDFAGVNVVSTITPQVKLHGTYVALEEESTGPRDGFIRGEDYAIIGSVEITPFKGLDLRPIYSYVSIDSIGPGQTRPNRGGVANVAAVFPAPGVAATFAPAVAGKPNFHEGRHTVGLDARFTAGPFTFDPTIFYQFGQRELVAPTNGTIQSQGLSAWFIDLRGGFRTGPLLIEGALAYNSGNTAGEDLRHGRRTVNYYQPLSTDTSYFAGGWMEIWSLGIDYFNIINSGAGGLNPGAGIGYDKYGRSIAAVRAVYAVTPAFSVRSTLSGHWTSEEVDTSEAIAAGFGRVTCDGVTTNAICGVGRVSDRRGDARFLGAEIDLGLTWLFAPGIAFDLAGGYMFAGPALSAVAITNTGTGQIQNGRDPKDIQTVAARLRFSF